MNNLRLTVHGSKVVLGLMQLSIKCRHNHVCIVGSGPSAFYAAQYLLKCNKLMKVDMLEKLPAPFGLVRYGVAPDHPEVKNVINTFNQVAKNPRFNFWGNVTVGRDVRLKELQQSYDAVLLAYGASIDKHMGIKGEDTAGVVSAKDFVNWYNGYPSPNLMQPDLDCDTVAIVGMGNVALDVTRILLSSTNRLKTTDIPEPVIATLSKSRVRRVVLVGRRGPLQSAFTLKEFREITVLPDLQIDFSPINVFEDTIARGAELDKFVEGLPRPRRRLTQFLIKTACKSKELGTKNNRYCDFKYLTSPIRVLTRPNSSNLPSLPVNQSNVAALEVCTNKLVGDVGEDQRSVRIEEIASSRIDCGLIVRSIGYRSLRIDPDLPFNEDMGVIDCIDSLGRVAPSQTSVAHLYASGWAKRGAMGVIVDTAVDARSTAQAILSDMEEASLSSEKIGMDYILPLLKDRGVRPVTFEDWERVDCAEKSAGHSLGKPREKFTSLDEILRIASKRPQTPLST